MSTFTDEQGRVFEMNPLTGGYTQVGSAATGSAGPGNYSRQIRQALSSGADPNLIRTMGPRAAAATQNLQNLVTTQAQKGAQALEAKERCPYP